MEESEAGGEKRRLSKDVKDSISLRQYLGKTS